MDTVRVQGITLKRLKLPCIFSKFCIFFRNVTKCFLEKNISQARELCPLQEHSSQNRCEWKSKGKV